MSYTCNIVAVFAYEAHRVWGLIRAVDNTVATHTTINSGRLSLTVYLQ